jgi:bacterioferritin-associated ferredoxin
MTKEDEKMIACRCEDISVQEIKDAIRSGYADLQSLKRYANFGLGPCQGKTCILLAAQILARETGRTLDQIMTPTARPPVDPVPMGFFAKGLEADDEK